MIIERSSVPTMIIDLKNERSSAIDKSKVILSF